MKSQMEILNLINSIEDLCRQARAMIQAPEGIEITIVNGDFGSYVHYWDGRNLEPRIIHNQKEKIEEEKLIELGCQALNMITPYAYDAGITWKSDLKWNKLPEQFQKLESIFKIKKITTEEE